MWVRPLTSWPCALLRAHGVALQPSAGQLIWGVAAWGFVEASREARGGGPEMSVVRSEESSVGCAVLWLCVCVLCV